MDENMNTTEVQAQERAVPAAEAVAAEENTAAATPEDSTGDVYKRQICRWTPWNF